MKVDLKNNNYIESTKKLLYTLYVNIIDIFEWILDEISRIVHIIFRFVSKMYGEFNSFFSITFVLKLLVQLAVISKIILTVPFLTISPAIKLLAQNYIDTLVVISGGITTMCQNLFDYYKVNNSTVLANEALEKDILQLREQMDFDRKITTERIDAIHKENSVLKAKVMVVQEKNDILTLSNNDLTRQLYKEKTSTQFDNITRWLSISSSTIMFFSSLTTLSFNIYRMLNGGGSSDSEVKSSIKEVLKLLALLNRNNVVQEAENRRTSGGPGVTSDNIPFDDVDDVN